jgi:hypothetical protein
MTTSKRRTNDDAAAPMHDDVSESEAADLEGAARQSAVAARSASRLVLASVREAIHAGLGRLHPEILQWGQTLLGSVVISEAPLKRSFKTQPALTSAGIGAIAVGGLLVALAFTRDNQGKTATRAN